MNVDFKNFWLVFAQIKPEAGYLFEDLVESESFVNEKYVGAWANLIVKSNEIIDALKLVSLGLKEKNFEVVFIDKIENVQSLVDYNELDHKILNEIEWLIDSDFVFMISDKIFPYVE